ncbi:sensor histidine kinase [Rhizobium cauense]|uniref:sensor histidine kinase n=1 Tax=Rhizobium cauense TaxID=1166683 RepID=UPI001C6E112A|nr:ATP-binding protein [Rhizobium cauense]MBW9118356.1 sensor histidine kinase [Rhizobium cauense]
MQWLSRWNSQSLASQFLIAGGCVSIAALFLIGFVVTHLIQNAVIHNSGAATALYVDSVVAPLLPDMKIQGVLDDASAQALDETLGQGALGQRLVSFRLWRGDGTILYANDKTLIGKRYPINDKLREALKGSLVARYEVARDLESHKERQLGKPLMEIYNPVLQPWSGETVGVLEFYETASGLADSLARARLSSWISVAVVTATFFLTLSVIVFRGSRLIESQRQDLRQRVDELSVLLAENQGLQRRLRRASQRAAALNETYLRSIGADLHDGPAQQIAYASLRLESDILVSATTTEETREKELSWIRSSLAEGMAEIRNICAGLVLPQVENGAFEEVVRRAVEAHQQKTRSVVYLVVEEDKFELAAAVKICVYRFIQEALNNAYRHGGGVQQSVWAVSRYGSVEVEVSDRGEGFDPDEVRPTSLGLAGLRERIDSLGGEFNVSSGDRGTTVSMKLDSKGMEEVE